MGLSGCPPRRSCRGGDAVTSALHRPSASVTTAARRVRAPAPQPWWGDVVGSAAFMSVVAVVALWLSNRGLQNLAGAGGVATTIGRLTGLVAADLLILQVLLMARIPWVERSYGQDKLARRHPPGGAVSVLAL